MKFRAEAFQCDSNTEDAIILGKLCESNIGSLLTCYGGGVNQENIIKIFTQIEKIKNFLWSMFALSLNCNIKGMEEKLRSQEKQLDNQIKDLKEIFKRLEENSQDKPS